jgi:CheY-like chemotaxis protein
MKPHILIVEDDVDIAESLQDFLENEDYGVSTAHNGQEAFAILNAENNHKLILLDLLMPVMNGLEFIEQKKQNQKLADIPVVVLSANNATQKICKENHIHYLPKPIGIEKLLSKIKELGA